jgi:radical SAM superfamily enzyme YgiQ (UPF0313 family)
MHVPRLLLINPSNSLVNMAKTSRSRWSHRYRLWKPLGLMVLAGLTPEDWQTSIVDENLGAPDYQSLPRPDLVGITAFTSQANRAYEIATHFRVLGVPVVMGGIHATMCRDEARERVDCVVTGEAEEVWAQVLSDAAQGRLKRLYEGGLADISKVRPARHDLLPSRYALGAIQTTRGCPLSCSFCSVTAFNGARYRQRPVPDIVSEFRSISEKRVLVVDDNLIGTAPAQISRAKELFRCMAEAKLGKQWVAQTTVNFADDEELLELAAGAGCVGVFIGFESPTPEGLVEIGKRFNLAKARDFPACVRRIRRHNIVVVGSFMIGLDVDRKGIGRRVADTATDYGVDNLNVSFLTPLPGTRLWGEMEEEGRIPLCRFPEDWRYYTLTYPVGRYEGLSLEGVIEEMTACNRSFYSSPRIAGRVAGCVYHRHSPLLSLVHNLSSRRNSQLLTRAYADFKRDQGERFLQAPAVQVE